MKKKRELRLTDITRYLDVEEGRLLLTVGEYSKSWQAIWLTDLRINVDGGHGLPRKTLPVRYKGYHGWVDCPRICLNRQNSMWIEPLHCSSWINMGVNLYLCGSNGWPEPLSRREYENLVQALLSYGIGEIVVERPKATIEDSRFHPNNIMGLEDFWDK